MKNIPAHSAMTRWCVSEDGQEEQCWLVPGEATAENITVAKEIVAINGSVSFSPNMINGLDAEEKVNVFAAGTSCLMW